MTSRKPIRSTMTDNLSDTKAPRPVPGRSSVLNVFIILTLQFCRKILFFDIKYRIAAYLSALFLLSIMTDVLPIPKSYFSSTGNILNAYFVKIGWFWTLFLSTPFVYFTSKTYCCDKRNMIVKHMARLLVATANWYIWVNLFIFIEKIYGMCIEKRDIKTKYDCVTSGHRWNGFDVSGHSFMLIYSTLMLIEECRVIVGWESIKDMIRDEAYTRVHSPGTSGPLHNLSNEDFIKMQRSYVKFLPSVRLLFVLITLLTTVWDLMLLSTIFYFHSMPEKLFGGVIAITIWLLTYHVWYKIPDSAPYYPGEGLIKYKTQENKPMLRKTESRRNSVPTFMGMPLNIQNNNTTAY